MSAAISRRVMSLRLAFAAVLLTGSASIALADPPARVGRLSFMEGTVSFHMSDQDQWSPATLNYPITTGASFWTEPRARTAIQVGDAELRMDQTTEVDIVRLDDDATQVALNQGVINIRLGQVPPGGVAVMTPLGQVNLVQPGVYHIDAGQPNGDQPPAQASVTVLSGDAQFLQQNSYVDIQAGATGNLTGNPVSITMAQGGPNDFDNWASTRDRRAPAKTAARYVSTAVTGYEDLDQYGDFDTDQNYGEVWYPKQVPSDWAPYRYGHWAFVSPWGWTWVDDAPWGFAPFHYGRWVQVHNRWGWVPGQRQDRPVYAPALVAFVGGAGFGVTISSGATPAVGWVPLAPEEVYRPAYPVSVNYVRQVNVANVSQTVVNRITTVNVTNVTINNFRNQRATTVVPTAAFTRAVPIDKVTVTVPQDQLLRARVEPSLTHVQPTAAARAGAADPKIAATIVAKPNEPANVAKGPVKPVALPPAAAAEAAAPKAPGPALRNERGGPEAGRGGPAGRGPEAGRGGPGGRDVPAGARGAAEERRFTPVPASAPATTPRPGQPGTPGAQPGTSGAAPAVVRPGQPPVPGTTGAPGPSIRPTTPATAPAETGRPGQRDEHAPNAPGGAPGPAVRPTTPTTAPAETGRPGQREEHAPNAPGGAPGPAVRPTTPATAPAETGRPGQREEHAPNAPGAAPQPNAVRPTTPTTAPAETGRPGPREEHRPNAPGGAPTPGPAVSRPAEPPRPAEPRPSAAPAVTPQVSHPTPQVEHREPPRPETAAPRPPAAPQAAPQVRPPEPPRPAPAAAPPPAAHPAAPPPPPAPHPAPAAAPKPPEPPKPAAPAATPEKKEP